MNSFHSTIDFPNLAISTGTTKPPIGFVGVFMGTVGVQILADANGGVPQNPASPFTAILEELMNLGGFAKGASIIAIENGIHQAGCMTVQLLAGIAQPGHANAGCFTKGELRSCGQCQQVHTTRGDILAHIAG